MNNKNLLILAGLLIFVGLAKPDVGSWFNRPAVIVDHTDYSAPVGETLKSKSEVVIKSLKSGGSSRKTDGKKLAVLFDDIGTLIELDGADEVIKNTEEIRQVNSLAGALLHLDIKGKYPDLGKAAQDLVVSAIGSDSIPLNKELRGQAVQAFKALAWACNEGAK